MPLTLSEQTLEPGGLDSNLDAIPHWLGKLFFISLILVFLVYKMGMIIVPNLIGLLAGLIELIQKVDFRILYTIIIILKQI